MEDHYAKEIEEFRNAWRVPFLKSSKKSRASSRKPDSNAPAPNQKGSEHEPSTLTRDFSGKVVPSLWRPFANLNQLDTIPSQELTGVDPVITVLCANLCQQIIKARDKSYFYFNCKWSR
jgi:hypothetical protein